MSEDGKSLLTLLQLTIIVVQIGWSRSMYRMYRVSPAMQSGIWKTTGWTRDGNLQSTEYGRIRRYRGTLPMSDWVEWDVSG